MDWRQVVAALGLSTLLFFKRRQVSTRFIESQTNPASPPPSHSTASETLRSSRIASDPKLNDSSSAETPKSGEGEAAQSEGAAAENEKWFYVGDGGRIGPVEEEEILDLMQSGQASRDTLLWRAGMADWKKAESTPLWAKRASSNAPPALPGSHVVNTLVWFIAAVPLVGALLELWISQTYGDVSLPQTFLIYAAVYTGLIIVDAKKIEKGGHNPDNIKLWIWFWLVPVYLYKRARTLGQPPSYFWSWVAAFLIGILVSGPALDYLGSGVDLSVRRGAENELSVTNIGDNPINQRNSCEWAKGGGLS